MRQALGTFLSGIAHLEARTVKPKDRSIRTGQSAVSKQSDGLSDTDPIHLLDASSQQPLFRRVD